jgi:hypothetical protein
VKLTHDEVQKRGIETIKKCFVEIPFLRISKIENESEQGKIDILVELERDKSIIVEVKNNGEPFHARNAVNHLLRYITKYDYGLFLAPYISQKAAEICKEAGIGYIDLSGNCFISFEGIYIEKTGNKNIFAEKRDLRSLYSPKATRILRVLLDNPRKNWKISELSLEAGISIGQASHVKQLLMAHEWIKIEDNGLRLIEPKALLIDWSINYNFRKNEVIEFYSLLNKSDLEAKLVSSCQEKRITYALTGFSGADRLAPMVRNQKFMAYVSNLTDDIKADLMLKEVSSGANVTLLIPFDEGVYYKTKEYDGINIVSPIQLFLDLKGYKGRGDEAAEAIFERIILPSW